MATVREAASEPAVERPAESGGHQVVAFGVMVIVLVLAPFFVYPLFLMKALCFGLFACAFGLLIGYVGLLSFGHAVFLGSAGYISAHTAKVWGWPPELAILGGAEVAGGGDWDIGLLFTHARGGTFPNTLSPHPQQVIFYFLPHRDFDGWRAYTAS